MTWEAPPQANISDKGIRAALIFALVAERLAAYYEHGQWLTEAQGSHLAADWLARSKRTLAPAERKHLSALSDDLARQMAASLSRQAGLFTVHEMMESLDPNHQSEVGQALMRQCEGMLDQEQEGLPNSSPNSSPKSSPDANPSPNPGEADPP